MSRCTMAPPVLLSLLAAVAFLSGCSKDLPSAAATVRFGTSASLDNLPFFVVAERAMDRRNGIRIQSKLYPGGTAIIAALAASELDAGSAGTVPLLDAAGKGIVGDTLVAVASNEFSSPEHPAGGVLVDSRVRGWKDLQGAYIAVNTPLSLGGWAIVDRLKSEGVAQYHLASIPLENMGLAVAGGGVRAAVMFEPYLTQSLQRGDGHLLDWVIGGAPLDRIQLSAIVMRRAYLDGSPKAAAAFLRTYVQAVRWQLGHETESRGILGRGLSVSARIAHTMILAEWRADCRNDPALLARMQETLLAGGSITTVVPPQSLYDETVLSSVLRDLR